jgi:hypothetical protein
LAVAGEPAGIELGCQPGDCPANGAAADEPRSNKVEAMTQTPSNWPIIKRRKWDGKRFPSKIHSPLVAGELLRNFWPTSQRSQPEKYLPVSWVGGNVSGFALRWRRMGQLQIAAKIAKTHKHELGIWFASIQ